MRNEIIRLMRAFEEDELGPTYADDGLQVASDGGRVMADREPVGRLGQDGVHTDAHSVRVELVARGRRSLSLWLGWGHRSSSGKRARDIPARCRPVNANL